MHPLEWLTVLLAAATFWLAWATRKMAKSTQQMAALEAEPYVALKAISVTLHYAGTPPAPPTTATTTPPPAPTGVEVALVLANPGKVLVQYRMASVLITINGQPIPPTSTFTNRGGALHPGIDASFIYPVIPLSPPVPSPVPGQIDLDLRYWSIDGQEHSMKATIDLQITPLPNSPIKWLYSSGPLFTKKIEA